MVSLVKMFTFTYRLLNALKDKCNSIGATKETEVLSKVDLFVQNVSKKNIYVSKTGVLIIYAEKYC